MGWEGKLPAESWVLAGGEHCQPPCCRTPALPGTDTQPGTPARGGAAGWPEQPEGPSGLWSRLPAGAWSGQSRERRWAPCEARGNPLQGCAGHCSWWLGFGLGPGPGREQSSEGLKRQRCFKINHFVSPRTTSAAASGSPKLRKWLRSRHEPRPGTGLHPKPLLSLCKADRGKATSGCDPSPWQRQPRL